MIAFNLSMEPSRHAGDSSPSEQLLLLQFAVQLQEWDTHTAAGLAAVNSLQRSFGEVDGTGSTLTNESLHVYQRLMELAPSFQLERYIQQRQHPTPTASDAASQIHAALNKLHAAVTSAQGLLECLSSISSQYQEAVLSQQLKCATQLSSVTAIACQAAAATVEGSRSLTAATSNPEPNDDDPEASTEAAVLQPEELAILMVAVVSGMQQDLQWMEAAASGISLATTAEELSTLCTLWELQPFTNEAAAASVMAAAEAAVE